MPTNLFGPGDNYNLETSHVFAALIKKFHNAKMNNDSNVTLWGSGNPKREFLHVDHLATVIIFAIENKLAEATYNVGSGNEISIKELANLIKKITKYEGGIIWDKTKPDGTPRKYLDSSKIQSKISFSDTNLEKSIKSTYKYFVSRESKFI